MDKNRDQNARPTPGQKPLHPAMPTNATKARDAAAPRAARGDDDLMSQAPGSQRKQSPDAGASESNGQQKP